MPKRPRRPVPPPPSEFFGLHPETGKLLEGYVLPEPLTHEAWERFFLAVRAMVARKYPGLLCAWDDASYVLWDGQVQDDPEATAEALDRLCTILEIPEAAKRPRFRPWHRKLYERTKELLVHCREIRRKSGGRRVQYFPLRRPGFDEPGRWPWEAPWPGEPVRPGSADFYRIALQQLYGGWKVPDDVLEKCTSLWEKPAQAALEVIAAYVRLKRTYVARRIYTHPRARTT